MKRIVFTIPVLCFFITSILILPSCSNFVSQELKARTVEIEKRKQNNIFDMSPDGKLIVRPDKINNYNFKAVPAGSGEALKKIFSKTTDIVKSFNMENVEIQEDNGGKNK